MLCHSVGPGSKDTAPQKLAEGLDVDKLKTEYGVLNASLDGPKIWQPDWVTVNAGVERDFNGIPATWVAQLNMGDNLEGVTAMAAYKPVTIARKSQVGWNKGTRVFLLDDPEGNTWILKGFQLGLKPHTPLRNSLPAGQTSSRNSLRTGFCEPKYLSRT